MTDLLDAAFEKIKAKPEPPLSGAPSIVPEMPMPLFDLTNEAIDAATNAERDAIITDLKEWGMLRLPFERIAIRFPVAPISSACGYVRFRDGGAYFTMRASGALTVQTFYVHTEGGEQIKLTNEQREAKVAAGTMTRRDIVYPVGIGSKIIYEWNDFKDKRIFTPPEGEAKQQCVSLCGEALAILLASLAARNVVKDVRYNANNQTTGDVPRYISSGITYLSRTIIRPPNANQLSTARGGLANGKLEIRLVRGHKKQVVADTTKPQPADVRVTVVGAGRAGRREQWIAPYYVNADAEFLKVPHYLVK
jgi:hypothetical protein